MIQLDDVQVCEVFVIHAVVSASTAIDPGQVKTLLLLYSRGFQELLPITLQALVPQNVFIGELTHSKIMWNLVMGGTMFFFKQRLKDKPASERYRLPVFIVLIHASFEQIFDKLWEGWVRVSNSIVSPGFFTNSFAIGSDEVRLCSGIGLKFVPGKNKSELRTCQLRELCKSLSI